jgi:hypothetical protein
MAAEEASSRPVLAAPGAEEDGRAEVAIMWFRRDLRVDDNPALAAALKYAKHVVSFLLLFLFAPLLSLSLLPPRRGSPAG